jgi:hypothetical protein
MNDKMETVLKEGGRGLTEDLSQHLPGGTEEIQERSQSLPPVSGPLIFELITV